MLKPLIWHSLVSGYPELCQMFGICVSLCWSTCDHSLIELFPSESRAVHEQVMATDLWDHTVAPPHSVHAVGRICLRALICLGVAVYAVMCIFYALQPGILLATCNFAKCKFNPHVATWFAVRIAAANPLWWIPFLIDSAIIRWFDSCVCYWVVSFNWVLILGEGCIGHMLKKRNISFKFTQRTIW